MIWDDLDVVTLCAMSAVMDERQRQEKLKRDGRFEFTCADINGLADAEKLAVLVEEVGEVAKEILTPPADRLVDAVAAVEALRTELVQVAAVAVAWIEALTEVGP